MSEGKKTAAKRTVKVKATIQSGPAAFTEFHIKTFGEKRWASLLNAMKEPTDHVAVVNPFVPARWIARELHRIGTKEFENLSSDFLQQIPVHCLNPQLSPSDDEDSEVEVIYNGVSKRNADRWPYSLPRVGSLPGDQLLDFAALNATTMHGSTVLDTENGPNNYGGMKDRCGYYLLDAASLCAPLVLNPQRGQRVLDVCAAPGGKSLIMAYLMFGRQQIQKSARELKATLSRLRDGGQETRTTVKHNFDGNHFDETKSIGSDDYRDIDEENTKTQAERAEKLQKLRALAAQQGISTAPFTSENDDEIREVRGLVVDVQPSEVKNFRELKQMAKQKMKKDFEISNLKSSPSEEIDQISQELQQLQLQLSSGTLSENDALAVEALADLLLSQLDAAQNKTELSLDALNDLSKNEEEDDDDDVRQQRSKLVLNDVSRQRCERLEQVVKDYIPFELWPEIDVVNVDATTCYQFGSITMNAFGRRQLVSSTNTKTGGVSAERTARRAEAQKSSEKNASLEELRNCQGEFDRIMLDAPCSSDRHLLHSPENMALWSEAATRAQAKRQIQLLRNSVKALKVGGRVVYSTCSLSPYENDGVVATILNEFPGAVKLHKFKLSIGEKTPYGYMILPDRPNCSWGPLYVAALERME